MVRARRMNRAPVVGVRQGRSALPPERPCNDGPNWPAAGWRHPRAVVDLAVGIGVSLLFVREINSGPVYLFRSVR